MHCHVCDAAVEEGQEVCHQCGASLKGVTDQTAAIPAIPAIDTDLTTELIETVRLDPTEVMPTIGSESGLFDGAAEVLPTPATNDESRGFRLRLSLVFALLAVPTVLLAGAADILEIFTSRPVDGIAVGLRTMEDFGENLMIAGLVGAGMMVLGSALSCFGLKWGAGLAGGSGLALVGWAAVTLGLAEVPIDNAERVTRAAGSDVNGFTLSITRDLGWFMIVAVAALGLATFIASLRMVGRAGRAGLNPWIAAVGALMMTIVAAGPLIPNDGGFDVNFGVDGVPREFFAARFIQLGLIAATGILGFLSVRTYGIGFAAGGISVATWMWITSLIAENNFPAPQAIGIAVGNIGTNSTTPHAVTTVAMAASLVMVAVAATLAVATRPRN